MPKLLQADHCCALVIDEQARLLPAVADADRVVANTGILIRAARRLGLPVLVSEQYPRGLGATVPEIAGLVDPGDVVEKTEFSCVRNPGWSERLRALGRPAAALAGVEAHVCVLQTAFDLLRDGFEVFVVEDAVGSRRRDSRDAALQRLARAGAEIVTTEMVVFEWLGDAAHPAFRELSALVK